jgi:hypothetical protein
VKKTIIPFLLLNLFMGLAAQKPQKLSKAQMQSTTMTAEKLLGLHSKLIVISCEISYQSGIYTVMLPKLFLKDVGIQHCLNGKCDDFATAWVKVAPLVGKGETITITYTSTQQDEKQMWSGYKTFVAP